MPNFVGIVLSLTLTHESDAEHRISKKEVRRWKIPLWLQSAFHINGELPPRFSVLWNHLGHETFTKSLLKVFPENHFFLSVSQRIYLVTIMHHLVIQKVLSLLNMWTFGVC